MMGNESTEESKKEIRKRPGAPSPPAKATIFCFQPFKFKGNRHPSLECGSPAAAFFHRLARRKFLTKLKRAKAQPARVYCENAARSKWFMKICINAVR